MSQSAGQKRATDAVAAELARRGWNASDLKFKTGIDYGTITDFLRYERWPRMKTQSSIERALDWAPGTIRLVSLGGDVPTPGGDGSRGESVGGRNDDDAFGTIKARKPANMSDEDFKRLLTEYQEEIEWKLDRAARERDE